MRYSSLRSLPKDVMEQLQQRLVDSGFSDFDSHREWLTGIGYNISRSAIHRYAKNCREEVLCKTADGNKVEMMKLRMRCLELSGTTDDPPSVIQGAENYLEWISRG